MLPGNMCRPTREIQELVGRTRDVILLTGDKSRRQHHGLEPYRKEVHDGEITKCNQEIAGSDEDRDPLLEQRGCKDGLNGNLQFNKDERYEKQDGENEGEDNPGVVPLLNVSGKSITRNRLHSLGVARYIGNSRTSRQKKPVVVMITG